MAGLRDWVTLYLKGIAMGSADAVPGVSGGTIALILGIYERLIAAVTAVDPDRIVRVLSGARPRNLPDARAAFHEVDGAFLAVLLAGIGTAVVVVLSGVDYLLETRPVATYGFFFGLIAASAAVLFDDVELDTPRRKAAAGGGFLLAFLASGYASTALTTSLPVVFVAGAVAVSAMILPGVSGSLLLVVLGQYEYMSGTVSRFVDGLVALALGNGTNALTETVPSVVTFLAGGVLGVFTIAHAVKYALSRARAATLAFLVSLIVGALRAPLVEVSIRLAESGESWRAAAPRFAVAALAGAALVLVLDRYSATIEY
jgi:putative membrane protein